MFEILIRPLEAKDSEISWKWRNDSEIWEFTGNRPNVDITLEIEKQWIEKVLIEVDTKRFAIIIDNIYVGNIQLTNITSIDAEYHIFIGDKNYWGKGIAFSATQQIIRFAKNILKLDNIYLKVNPQNKRAINLYQKCGFKKISEEIKMVVNLNETIQPMVSIFCMVYNHEPFLKQCLDGFLMQKCYFDFEIIIGEDCSTDNSRAIIEGYARKYPGKFKLLLYKTNVGAVQNQKNVFENCRGKYIAMCEGDDYWTDPLKLQKQVDFLESNEAYSFTCHRFNVTDFNKNILEDSIHPPYFVPYDKDLQGVIITKEMCFDNWFPQPLTTVLRKDCLSTIDFSLFKYFRDTHLYYFLLNENNGFCFEWVGGVYRKHSGGIYNGSTRIKRILESFLIFEELYLYTKEAEYLKRYARTSIELVKNKQLLIVFNSFTKKLSLIDLYKTLKFIIYYSFKKLLKKNKLT